MENGSGTQVSSSVSGELRRVGLVYDERMCKHSTPRGEPHPENPDRIRAIWNKLLFAKIPQRCVVFDAKEVEDKYIAAVHTSNHINLIKTISSKKFASHRNKVAEKYNSIYFNEGSSESAYLAAGSVLDVATKVAKGELNSAFAIVRPPGHHAEETEPMGFCLFNNVAIATSFLLNQKELGINKILIVDWDVHHGNGTQKTFWKDSQVLFFSVHRHEFGCFYPCSDDGSHIMMGEGEGLGYNINVPWENGRCGDADYNAVWDHILIPVAREFKPDIILISAGFDAAIGDPLGGCCITPNGYSTMLKKLMEFSNGKIVMALEGGYNLNSIANSVVACVEMLLEDKPVAKPSIEVFPFDSTWKAIKEVRKELSAYWPILAEKLPEKLTSKARHFVQIYSSQSEDEYDEGPNTVSEDLQDDITLPLSKLKVTDDGPDKVTSQGWRSELSKIDVWYASFGSNMSESRFLCYIQGGQAEGMRRPCKGAVDKSQPKEVLWKTVPHRLFFGRESTVTWGPGGVAFLDPESNNHDKTFMCLYKITLEQFNDVLLQENVCRDTDSPFFDLNDLDSIEYENNICLEALKEGWYCNVVYLGKEKDVPILTMTCTSDHVEGFKSGKIPLRPPAKEYADTLVRGLVMGKQLSQDEAIAYINEASTKPLSA